MLYISGKDNPDFYLRLNQIIKERIQKKLFFIDKTIIKSKK